jgi:hypothetical protein
VQWHGHFLSLASRHRQRGDPVDNDPCAPPVLWSTISAASADSTFAGLLAGLLIAAAAALLVSWYQATAPPTIALFGSGVPVLTLSTYLFTVIGALRYPDPKNIDYGTPGGAGDKLCSQLWSEWLLATGSLFIGSAVLVCGLGWALVSYADNLAVKLCERSDPMRTVERSRDYFIRLNAWLSAAVTTAATALLIVTSVIYVVAIGQQNMHFEMFGEKWYLLYFVYLFGLYLIGRAAYVVFNRTHSARRANKESCAAYAAGSPPEATDNEGADAWRKKLAMRAARELGFVACVAIAALAAIPMASGAAFNHSRGIAVSPHVVIYLVVLYIIFRAIYILLPAGIIELVSANDDDPFTNNEATSPTDEKSTERIRIRYDFGRLSTTTYSVVFLAILGTFFVVVLTQGPLWTVPRIMISLFLGGFYPAIVLSGLSSSVPAAEDIRTPKWETIGWLKFIP